MSYNDFVNAVSELFPSHFNGNFSPYAEIGNIASCLLYYKNRKRTPHEEKLWSDVENTLIWLMDGNQF